jgi:glutamine synthetase
MQEIQLAEYIWLDGAVPVRQIRSKARTVSVGYEPEIKDFPEWSFDGSSTGQAEGGDSDCILKPVCVVDDPMRGIGNYLVLCEVYSPDGKTPHASNSRAQLRAVLDAGAAAQDPWIGFEQEYTVFDGHRPIGWPEHGFPAAQGPYYCGVGSKQIFGRELAERHAAACIEAGLIYYGLNAEVMPGQWEFQIGYRGLDGENATALNICDHMWIARWLIHRVSEEFGYHVSLDNKPVVGDWNGAGMHTNFSTTAIRDPKTGRKAIDKAVDLLGRKHKEHIAVYGYNLAARLTGRHETCDINTFKAGVADRGSSIRVPRGVELHGSGYFEDRRPGANADPYLVATRLCATVCEVDDSVITMTSWPEAA